MRAQNPVPSSGCQSASVIAWLGGCLGSQSGQGGVLCHSVAGGVSCVIAWMEGCPGSQCGQGGVLCHRVVGGVACVIGWSEGCPD